jgi:sucrose-6-phosphate hydrolase SacC (GH32 family)
MWWGTGSFVFHEGTYYTLQKFPHMWETHMRGVRRATSSDGTQFVKDKTYPVLDGEDVDIFRDERTGVYHLLTGKNTEPGEPHTILRWESTDLVNWNPTSEAFIITDDDYNVNVCPHLFEWNGWYYFFGGFTENSGVWVSEKQFGPWRLHTPERLDMLAVPKTALFADGRRILAGFLEDHGWGGSLVFRELVQHDDGSLGTRFPPEMVPPFGRPIKPSLQPRSDGVTNIDSNSVKILETDYRASALIRSWSADMRMTIDVLPPAAASSHAVFGIGLKYDVSQERGLELRFHPEEQRVELVGVDREDTRTTARAVIRHVTGLSRRFKVEILIMRDIVDVCIDDRRTVIARYWNPEGTMVTCFSKGGSVTFESVKICPLSEQLAVGLS